MGILELNESIEVEKFINSQEPLGDKFEEVLFANLWELYE